MSNLVRLQPTPAWWHWRTTTSSLPDSCHSLTRRSRWVTSFLKSWIFIKNCEVWLHEENNDTINTSECAATQHCWQLIILEITLSQDFIVAFFVCICMIVIICYACYQFYHLLLPVRNPIVKIVKGFC